jgi:hypothetical protein
METVEFSFTVRLMELRSLDGKPKLRPEVAPKDKHTGGIYESYGRGWLIKPDAEKQKALKEGEWNEMVVRMKGNTVTTWLNGQQMVEFTDEKIGAADGKIALQIHDGGGVKVRWRNIRIQEL